MNFRKIAKPTLSIRSVSGNWSPLCKSVIDLRKTFLNSKGEIKVVSGEAETVDAILDFISRAEDGWCDCGDKNMPSIAVNLAPINESIRNAAKRNYNLRYITEITVQNIEYCKELVKWVDLRHLDGVKLNFAVSHTHYMAATTLYEGKPVPQIVYTNVKELVAQQQYAFDALWDMSMPALQRINEIELGLEPERMQLIADPEETKKAYQRILSEAKKSVLLALATKNAFGRNKAIGILQLLVELAHRDNISIRLLVHHEVDLDGEEVRALKKAGILVNQLSANVLANDDHTMEPKVSLVVVDEEISLTI
jgi:two-component system sensor histidine kinase VicK